jgi:hypothetical protein
MRQSQARDRTGWPLRWEEPPVNAGGIDQETFHLPVGTATFMLAGVEGPARVRECLLDEAISRHGGVRRRQQDDATSVMAAFTGSSDAVAAALYIQRAVHAESWRVKLRIALHTAEAQRRDERSYFGQAVNRCARLVAVAHGGQVVLSRTTRDLVLDRLPDRAELVDSAFIDYVTSGGRSMFSDWCTPTCQRSFHRCARWTRCSTTCPVS